MSQLTSLVKQINALQTRFDEAQQSLSQFSETDSLSAEQTTAMRAAVHALQRLCDELSGRCSEEAGKLRAKMSQTDPVTGESRFGKQSQEKFAAADQQLHSLLEEAPALLAEYESKCSMREQALLSAEQETARERERQREEEREREREREEALRAETERRREEEERARRREVEEAAQLHQRAEAARRKRAEEAAAMRVFESQFERDLLRLSTDLGLQCAHMSTDAKRQHLQHIKEFLAQEKATGRSLRDVLSMIINILERIIARPDDVNARRLRLTHSAIQSRLTSVRGCVQLLVGCGFKPTLKNATTNEIVSVRSHSEEDLSLPWCQSLSQMNSLDAALSEIQRLTPQTTIADLTSVVTLLNPHSPFEIILEMEEPVVDHLALMSQEVGNRDAWLEWYDALKNNKTMFEDFLRSSR